MDYKIRVFVGAPSCPAMGFWLTLPMDKLALERLMTTQVPREYIISDYESELDIDIKEHACVEDINDLANKFKLWHEAGELSLWLAAYQLGEGNLDYAHDLLISGNYEFYDNVEDTKQLGEAIVKKGRVKVPQHLLDGGYIDFWRIGNDWECNGCRIFKHNAAIMQTKGLND